MTHFRLSAVLLLAVILVAGCGFVISGAPQLVSPPNGSTHACQAQLTFVWTTVPNAVEYIFELVDNDTGVIEMTTPVAPPATSTVADTARLCDGTFRWRVGATFPNNATPSWSGFWTVVIQP